MKHIILTAILTAVTATGVMACNYVADDYAIYYSNDGWDTIQEMPFVKPNPHAMDSKFGASGTFGSAKHRSFVKNAVKESCVNTAIEMKQVHPTTSFSCFNKTTQKTIVSH